MFIVLLAIFGFAWHIGVLLVCSLGYYQLYRYYKRRPLRAVCESLPHHEIPHVTIIRPTKGIEPELYSCLASTFQQTYPKDKLTIYLCISSQNDPALPVLQQLIRDHDDFDCKVLVEDEDPELLLGGSLKLGPNPKIRNMSRAYREAKGDLVWIIDCNVWAGKGVCGRMVDTLCGYSRNGSAMKYKFVHQLPLAVDVTVSQVGERAGLLNGGSSFPTTGVASTSTASFQTVNYEDFFGLSPVKSALRFKGGYLEEMFLSSAHGKWYTAINTVLIAPCIVGKSNMFRRSHLDSLTYEKEKGRPHGIDFFSYNICEDHLIGDLLWKNRVPEEEGPSAERIGKHSLVFGDLVIQPVAAMSVLEYMARRARWLRVRKFTVTLATFVEPGTECFLSSIYGAFGFTSIPWLHEQFQVPQTWTAFFIFWLISVILWSTADWNLYKMLHSMGSVEVDENTPAFARGVASGKRRSYFEWLCAWAVRETVTLHIWMWAVYGGVTVNWRGKRFQVGLDMRVHELEHSDDLDSRDQRPLGFLNGSAKPRTD